MSVLGCATTYSVVLTYAIPADKQYVRIPAVTSVSWNRVLSARSDAVVVIPVSGIDERCCRDLVKLDCWGFVVNIYRDDKLVWVGPIIDILYDTVDASITITAVDIIAYLDRGVPYRGQIGNTVHTTILQMLQRSWPTGPGPVFGDPFRITALYDSDAISHAQNTQADNAIRSRTMHEVLVDAITVGTAIFASPYRFVYTTIGRKLYVQAEKTLANTAANSWPKLVGDDFESGLQIRYLGEETWTAASAYKLFLPTPVDITDFATTRNFYGPLVAKFDADDIKSTVYATANTEAQTLIDRTLDRGQITPRVLIIPDNAQLAPTANVSIDDLYCGNRIDVQAKYFCEEIRQSMLLARVSGTWSAQGETPGVEQISVSLVDMAAN